MTIPKNVEPLFPFGYGLSYTQFKYSNIKMPLNVDPSSDGVSVSFNITNIGNREGMEVAQLYIRDLECSVPRPLKELKGFEKIYLRAGETKNVNLFLNQRSFQFYNPEKKAWMSEPGKFEVLIGSSSKDIWLNGQIMMK